MKKSYLMALVFVFCMSVPTLLLATQDDPSCKEHPLFSRMPNYYLTSRVFCEEVQFDSFQFNTGRKQQVTVEGKKFVLTYDFDRGAGSHPTPLQIQRNYANAVRKIGGKVLMEFDDSYRETHLMVKRDNKEVWARVRALNEGKMIELTIIEKELMQQDVTANAEAMGADIKDTGKVAIYGIYFDTGKALIKPESDAAMAEIARLLKQQMSLKVYIVGHTDSAGSFDANMRLSQARAEAVVKSLTTRHGIDARRLKGYGVSSLAPASTNRTEEGKAKNRRVELVEQ